MYVVRESLRKNLIKTNQEVLGLRVNVGDVNGTVKAQKYVDIDIKNEQDWLLES